MKDQTWMNCSMCGFRFDPGAHVACKSCPLQSGCSVVCCPSCGYEMVDVNQSRLAGLVLKLGARLNSMRSS